jgi:uncharacterized protein YjbJ (UPF0337 family)
MDPDQIRGKWNQIKGAVKQKWGKLTDDDFLVAEGNLDELIGKIQQRYGLEKDKVKQDIDQLLQSISEDRGKAAA